MSVITSEGGVASVSVITSEGSMASVSDITSEGSMASMSVYLGFHYSSLTLYLPL